jgi:hypothetical protein
MFDHHDDETPATPSRPLADREVPLPTMAAADLAQAAVHGWLDGERSEDEAHAAAPAQVRFWGELMGQVAHHRARTAPASLVDAIMNALPPVSPGAPLADAPVAAPRAAAPRGGDRPADRSAPPR